MKALFIEHDHTSPPGPIGDAFAKRGYEIDERVVVSAEHYYSPNVEFDFPSIDEYDVIVPMGSPWGAWDDATIGAWLLPELEYMREADRRGIPVFGICFGGARCTPMTPNSSMPVRGSNSTTTAGPCHLRRQKWLVPAGPRRPSRCVAIWLCNSIRS
jgi:hypothetical protein